MKAMMNLKTKSNLNIDIVITNDPELFKYGWRIKAPIIGCTVLELVNRARNRRT